MIYKTFFKIGWLCFTMLLLSCEKDEVKVTDSAYVSGGIGTSQTTGAIEFNFNIPSSYTTGRVYIEFPDVNISNEVIGTGDKQISFRNVSSGIYNYTFEFWGTESNYSGGDTIDPPLSKFFSIDETLEVRNGKTLKINVHLD